MLRWPNEGHRDFRGAAIAPVSRPEARQLVTSSLSASIDERRRPKGCWRRRRTPWRSLAAINDAQYPLSSGRDRSNRLSSRMLRRHFASSLPNLWCARQRQIAIGVPAARGSVQSSFYGASVRRSRGTMVGERRRRNLIIVRHSKECIPYRTRVTIRGIEHASDRKCRGTSARTLACTGERSRERTKVLARQHK